MQVPHQRARQASATATPVPLLEASAMCLVPAVPKPSELTVAPAVMRLRIKPMIPTPAGPRIRAATLVRTSPISTLRTDDTPIMELERRICRCEVGPVIGSGVAISRRVAPESAAARAGFGVDSYPLAHGATYRVSRITLITSSTSFAARCVPIGRLSTSRAICVASGKSSACQPWSA